jgi:glycosyltransferase involved in cell wall biosynthesis
MAPIDWSVAVFARNEERSITRCLEALEVACECQEILCTVLVNGSTDRTKELALKCVQNCKIRIEVLEIKYGDKSNAWNAFIYDCKPEADLYFFVDSYIAVQPKSLRRLAAVLEAGNGLNAATGVPTRGRSASMIAGDMLRSGGMHGSLHALPCHFVQRIVKNRYRLPKGLYRGDGLIGSMAMHDLDPLGHPWRPDLVAVVSEATWDQRVLSVLRPSDLARHWRRNVQQARGRLEIAAIKSIIYRNGYGALPDSADDMIKKWLSQIPEIERRKYHRDPFTRLALRRIQRGERPDAGAIVKCCG